MHTVQSAFEPVSGGSARIGGDVGPDRRADLAQSGDGQLGIPEPACTSGIQGDVHQVRTGLHLAARAAAVRIRNATSGTQGAVAGAAGVLHLAARVVRTRPRGCYIWRSAGPGRAWHELCDRGG